MLEYDDYYQSVPSLRGNGIGIGFSGNADNTIIRFNKIHDVGQCQAYDHVIYLSHGNNVQIYDNWLWNDAHGRGVQLYPAPTNAKIFDNVIDHVGEGFVIGNESGDTVSGNQIYNNVITNTTGLPSEGIPGEGISDNYGGRPGSGNTFYENVLYNNPGGIGTPLPDGGRFLRQPPVSTPDLTDPCPATDFRPDAGGTPRRPAGVCGPARASSAAEQRRAAVEVVTGELAGLEIAVVVLARCQPDPGRSAAGRRSTRHTRPTRSERSRCT